MRQAQRAHRGADRPLADDELTEQMPALDEAAVLNVLEQDVDDDDDAYRPIVGIRNGILIGLGFWAVVLGVLGVMAGLGYL